MYLYFIEWFIYFLSFFVSFLCLSLFSSCFLFVISVSYYCNTFTVKPRPEAHMEMIHFDVFLKSIDLIPQPQIWQRHYITDNVIVLSDLVESSEYSSKKPQKGSCPYAPLDKVLRYSAISYCSHNNNILHQINQFYSIFIKTFHIYMYVQVNDTRF